jgi:hypothetical protein
MHQKSPLLVVTLCSILAPAAAALPKPHIISFGKWTSVKWAAAGTEA